MRLASFTLSLCLHAGLALLVVFWPAPEPKAPEASLPIIVVEGLPGGNRTPSPILGPQGESGKTLAPPTPAPAAPPKPQSLPPEPAHTVPVPAETPPLPKPEPIKPVPKPEPESNGVPLAEKKTPQPPRPDPPKEDKKPEPKKPEPSKGNEADDLIKKLRDAKTKSPQGDVDAKIISNALVQARKNAGGHGGGGGGEGQGESGGGLLDVYRAQLIMAVRPNWSWPGEVSRAREVELFLKMDASGMVVEVRITRSSGSSVFDSATVTAVRNAGELPPPPPTVLREGILITFTPD